MDEEWIARKGSDGRIQTLEEHAENVAKISASISHFPNTSKLISYLHDSGKLSDEFQAYIRKEDNQRERGSVIHAWQGAFLIREIFEDKNSNPGQVLLKELISMCVTAHHNHLADGVSLDGSSRFHEKLGDYENPKYHYDEIRGRFSKEPSERVKDLFSKAELEMNDLIDKIIDNLKSQDSANFALGLTLKYLFSCLIDADRLDAYLFEIDKPYQKEDTNWDILLKKFEDNISAFPIENEMDYIRRNISEKCKEAADKETGIYQLSVATGGGKTLSSLRFALHHAKKYNKKRIIYVIPYLSIIEQTAKSIRDILGCEENSNLVLEHHSNIASEEDEKSTEMHKLSTSRWDSPIIITTMVQFLESTMSSKSSKLRKFASMADSVIILDEIQSLPLKTVHCFNEVISFLSQIMNSSVLLCSATQPTLEDTQRENLALHKDVHLINAQEDFKDIKRVKISPESDMNNEEASEFIYQKSLENGSCLVVVNTRRSAMDLYEKVSRLADDFRVLHLSTSMCSAHRMKVIDEIREALDNKEKIICISTQLIEAGVDVSFSCVIRAMSGLDSIAQAAGRCNRNGESQEAKTTYTFLLKDENLNKLDDIKLGRNLTREIIKDNPSKDLLDEDIMKEFYKKYYEGKTDQMDYSLGEDGNVYALLSENKMGRMNFYNRNGQSFTPILGQAFYTADKNFKVIDDKTRPIVVLYGESEELIRAYQRQPSTVFTKEKVKILRQLEKYSVSVYEWQLKELDKQNALNPIDREDESLGAIYLNSIYYSHDTGLILEANMGDLII